MLDLRSPIGWLFIIIGTLLVGAGYLHPVSSRCGDLTVNLNLAWGSLMGLFGLAMAGAALSARRR